MASPDKETRNRLVDTNNPLRKHSMNQEAMKTGRQGEIRFFNEGGQKAEKARDRAKLDDFYSNRFPTTGYQLEMALKAAFGGEITGTQLKYLADNLDMYADPIETCGETIIEVVKIDDLRVW